LSPALPVLKPRVVVAALERAGFFIHHSRGSHVQLKHRDHPELRITVPYHSGDLPPGTLRSIIRQAGLTVEQFSALLWARFLVDNSLSPLLNNRMLVLSDMRWRAGSFAALRTTQKSERALLS